MITMLHGESGDHQGQMRCFFLAEVGVCQPFSCLVTSSNCLAAMIDMVLNHPAAIIYSHLAIKKLVLLLVKP